LKTQLQKIASSRTGGIKTDEMLGKTGAGPEGLPHFIIVTAKGIQGDVPPTLDVSRAVTAATEIPDGIGIEEEQPVSKPGRRQTAKTRFPRNGQARPQPSHRLRRRVFTHSSKQAQFARAARLT
jgi:DNA topoisomerase-6 subunit B